jgi:hypothetical protein
MWKQIILFLGLFALCSGGLYRHKDHSKNQHNVILFIGNLILFCYIIKSNFLMYNFLSDMIQEAALREFKNYTETGYRSELFNQIVASLPYSPNMARNEVDDYT